MDPVSREKFPRFPKIRRLGDDENKNIFKNRQDYIFIPEKVDGANFRFMRGADKIIFGSRNLNFEGHSAKNFQRAIDYVLSKTTNEDLKHDLIYVLEFMTKHTIQYDWDTIPTVIGLDIMVHIDNVHGEHLGLLPFDKSKEEFERINIPVIPILWEGPVSKLKIDKLEELITKSNYGDVQMEGIVIKNYDRINKWGRPLFAKIVTEHFKEINKIGFGGQKKTNDESIKLANLFATPNRIRKMIMKLTIEENMELGMTLMQKLPIRIWLDIWEEEWYTIIVERKTQEIDLRSMRKKVTDMCLKELQRYLKEQVEK